MKRFSITKWLYMMCLGLAAYSCNDNDNPGGGQQLEEDQVLISAKLPGDYASRADEVFQHKLRYIMELWTAGEDPHLVKHEEQLLEAAKDFTIDTRMDAGTYTCVFWADYVAADAAESEVAATVPSDIDSYKHYADKYFNTSDLRVVKVLDNLAMIDNPASDAFFFTGELKKEKGKGTSMEIQLVRPMTKISFIENNQREFSRLTGVKTSYQAYTTFNVLAGVRGKEKVTVEYDNQSFNPTKVNDRSLMNVHMFANENDVSLGAVTLYLKHEKFDEPIEVNVPDMVPLARGSHVKVYADMLKESPTEVEISFDINVEEWKTVDKEIWASKPKAKVGDFFYADGTFSTDYIADKNNPVIGVVFAVAYDGGAAAGDDVSNYPGLEDKFKDGINGWVVAINEEYDGDKSGYKAAAPETTLDADFAKNFGQGTSDISGYKNTALFKAMKDDEKSQYPVAEAILAFDKHLKAPENTSGWYWGATGQYLALAEVYGEVGGGYLTVGKSIEQLKNKGVGALFLAEKTGPDQVFYWSSSTKNSQFIRVGLFPGQKHYGATANYDGTSPRHYRPVLTF